MLHFYSQANIQNNALIETIVGEDRDSKITILDPADLQELFGLLEVFKKV